MNSDANNVHKDSLLHEIARGFESSDIVYSTTGPGQVKTTRDREVMLDRIRRLDQQLQAASAAGILDPSEELVLQDMKAAVADYDRLTTRSLDKDVIPTWQFESGKVAVPHSLRAMRFASELSQVKVGAASGMSQPVIAELEKGDKTNFEIETLERYAGACGYRFFGAFVRDQVNHPRVPSVQLGMEVVVQKYYFGNSACALEQAFRVFLERLKVLSGADLLTCYVVQSLDNKQDPVRNELSLFHHIGVWDQNAMKGAVKRANVPFGLLGQAPSIIDDPSEHEALRDSEFRRREKVAWLMSIPFNTDAARGGIFLNYREGEALPCESHRQLLDTVPQLIHFLLCGGGPTTLSCSSPREASLNERQAQQAAGLARLVANVAQRGMSNDRVMELLSITWHLLSPDAPQDDLVVSWHEVDDEQKYLDLKYALPMPTSGLDDFRVRMDLRDAKRTWRTKGDAKGIVARAFLSGRSVLVEDLKVERELGRYVELPGPITNRFDGGMQSELAVPLNRFDGRPIGVINFESSRLNRFKPEHARLLEEIGHAITAAMRTHQLVAGRNAKLREKFTYLLHKLIGPRETPQKRMDALAEMAVIVFKADLVDVWEYDHGRGEFCGDAATTVTSDRFAKKLLGPVDPQLFRPRRRGNSVRMVEERMSYLPIPHAADRDERVCHETLRFGIKSLLGVAILGPESFAPDGVLWLRYLKARTFDEQFIMDAQTFASFVHVVWNPLKYHLSSDLAGADPAALASCSLSDH